MNEIIIKCQKLVQALESQKQSYNVLLMEDIIDILAGKTTPEKVGDKWISIKQCNNTPVDGSDKKAVIDLAKTHSHLYKYFNCGMRCDRDVFIEYVISDPENYNHGPAILRNDRFVAYDLVTRNGSLLEYLEDEYKSDEELILRAALCGGELPVLESHEMWKQMGEDSLEEFLQGDNPHPLLENHIRLFLGNSRYRISKNDLEYISVDEALKRDVYFSQNEFKSHQLNDGEIDPKKIRPKFLDRRLE